MVTTTFIGRLGNSMFQVAAAIGYARKYGYQWGVPNEQKESSILTHFPHLPRCNNHYRRYNEHRRGHDHDWFNYHEIPDHGPDTNLFGFWQSWKYFDHCKDEVKKVFKLKHVPGYELCVSVHVRRGDYVQHSGSFPPVTKEYILNAMQYFLDLNNGLVKFVVFSDDIAWCKENIKLHYVVNQDDPERLKLLDALVEFSEGRNEFEDLSLMASCGHHIIANSTFSWWGAYLGHNPDRIVISPSAETWFGPTSGVKQPVIDLLPDSWIKIHTR